MNIIFKKENDRVIGEKKTENVWEKEGIIRNTKIPSITEGNGNTSPPYIGLGLSSLKKYGDDVTLHPYLC